MKITAVRMSKAGWLPKLVSKLYLQRDRILVFLAAFLIAGSNIFGTVPLGGILCRFPAERRSHGF